MIGRKPNWYWKIMWAFASPLLIISLFIFYITDYILTGTLQYQAWDAAQVTDSQLSVSFPLARIPARLQPSRPYWDGAAAGENQGAWDQQPCFPLWFLASPLKHCNFIHVEDPNYHPKRYTLNRKITFKVVFKGPSMPHCSAEQNPWYFERLELLLGSTVLSISMYSFLHDQPPSVRTPSCVYGRGVKQSPLVS